MTLTRFLSGYYLLGTLVFAVLDWVLAAPIRAVFLDRPMHRVGYYGLLVALGLLCRAKPRWTPVVGIAESSVNLLLVLLSVMLPIYAVIDQAESGSTGAPFTTLTLANVLLSGGVLIYSFHRSQRALMKQTGRLR